MKILGKRKLQEGMESEALEITVEGDLAVVKVEGEEVEAVRIEEGDDLVQVVEEIKIDYLEGKLGKKGKKGKRKLQESSGWVGFKPRKRLLEGMVMNDKVTRVTLANPGDASSYEGVVAGESRVFEVSLTPSREEKVLGPIVPYWAMKDHAGVNIVVFDGVKDFEDAGADMIYMEVSDENHKPLVWMKLSPDKISFDRIYKYFKDGRGIGYEPINRAIVSRGQY